MVKRAALYARVSKDDSANDGRNLKGQLDLCREYAQGKGWEVVAEFQEDERGVSGASMDAPQLNLAIDMAFAGRFDVLVVREMDRLARSLAKQLIVEENFERAGVSIVYALGDFGDTPDGRMMKNFRAVFAEHERLKIIERTKRGRRQKAAAGKWPCDGHAGYGYCKVGKGKEARLAIDETEAETVRRIFALYVGIDGRPMAFQEIAALLTAEGVPPPNRGYGTVRPGSGWYRHTLSRLVDSRRYIGELRYGDIEIFQPDMAIVSHELFAAAALRRSDSRAKQVRARKYEFLLAGHLRCVCGVGMSGRAMGKGRNYKYYGCNRGTNARHLNTCHEPYVRADLADVIVWDWLYTLLSDNTVLEMGLNRRAERRAETVGAARARMATVEKLIQTKQGAIRRLAKALANDDSELYTSAIQGQLQTESHALDALKRELEKLQTAVHHYEVTPSERSAILEMAAAVRGSLQEQPSFEQKRTLLNMLDVTVELEHADGERCLSVTCGLRLKPNGEQERTRMSFPSVVRKSSSTSGWSGIHYSPLLVFSSTLPIAAGTGPGGPSTASDFFAVAVSFVTPSRDRTAS